MWLTHVSQKNKSTFGPSQPPCILKPKQKCVMCLTPWALPSTYLQNLMLKSTVWCCCLWTKHFKSVRYLVFTEKICTMQAMLMPPAHYLVWGVRLTPSPLWQARGSILHDSQEWEHLVACNNFFIEEDQLICSHNLIKNSWVEQIVALASKSDYSGVAAQHLYTDWIIWAWSRHFWV
jgi:hypothetical protein